MERISIFKISKGTFREDSIEIVLLCKESAISPATHLNELYQVICNFNMEIMMGDFKVDAFGPQTAIIEGKFHTYDMADNKPTHLNRSLFDQVHILKSFPMEFKI